ncbi:MAG: hypothetical protein NXI22_01720 [bacterium]|nr:hypothetical protein [bacterium]
MLWFKHQRHTGSASSYDDSEKDDDESKKNVFIVNRWDSLIVLTAVVTRHTKIGSPN